MLAERLTVSAGLLAQTCDAISGRVQALHVKMASIALVAAAANVPFGAWREHFDKFSLGWFVAVHATIPFIALLRKGVVMPRWAILLTITGAIAGQTVGSRLERRRLAALSSEPASHPPEPCLRATPVASLAMLPGDLYSSPVPSMDGNVCAGSQACSSSCSLQSCHVQEASCTAHLGRFSACAVSL